MSTRSTADQDFEQTIYAVTFADTKSSKTYRCVVIARTATHAIDLADKQVQAAEFKTNYAITAVEPLIPYGISEVTD